MRNISVTMLSSYLYCKRKLYLGNVLGIRAEIPKDVLVKGSIRHKAFEDVYNSEEKIVKSITKNDISHIKERYRTAYSSVLRKVIIKSKSALRSIELPLDKAFKEFWPAMVMETEERAQCVSNFLKKEEVYGMELWERLTPKIRCEYRIFSDTLGLSGMIDRMEVYPDMIIPIELKTGRAPKEGIWPGHKIQIGAYMLLLNEHFNMNVKEGFVKYLDGVGERKIVMNPFFRDEIVKLVGEVNSLLKSDEIPGFCSNENKCKACDIKEECHNAMLLSKKAKSLNRN